MEWKERAALVAALTSLLKEKGSWCGETHLQKAVYFAEELGGVDLGYDFILYKHGPFSFEFRDDLNFFRSRNLLKLEPQPAPYGPSYEVTETGNRLYEAERDQVDEYQPALEFIANRLGGIGAIGLERLSTALYVTKELGPDAKTVQRAERLTELKPHVQIESATKAVEAVDDMLAQTR